MNDRSGRLRIIAGAWRSRVLRFPDADSLRPTPDRVRETLFNWLQADIPGSTCLDLFAGSGALGFEAASRGAAAVVMVEQERRARQALQANSRLLEAESIRIVHAGALSWLERNTIRFDIVFLDPPYGSGLVEQCCELLEHGQSLRENARIYIEHAADELPHVPARWQCLRERRAGRVAYQLFSRE